MKTLVCLLEEPSAEEMLKGVLPKILSNNICVRYLVFEGKQDLEKQAKNRLQGWRAPNSVFLIMRDQDTGDCVQVKQHLTEIADQSNKKDAVIIRIACHELESFYLGDLSAVEQGLEMSGIARQQNKSKYRTPDRLANPSEVLERLSKHQYQKVSGSRAIAPYLKIDGSNRSCSFNVLLNGIKKITCHQQSGAKKAS